MIRIISCEKKCEKTTTIDSKCVSPQSERSEGYPANTLELASGFDSAHRREVNCRLQARVTIHHNHIAVKTRENSPCSSATFLLATVLMSSASTSTSAPTILYFHPLWRLTIPTEKMWQRTILVRHFINGKHKQRDRGRCTTMATMESETTNLLLRHGPHQSQPSTKLGSRCFRRCERYRHDHH